MIYDITRTIAPGIAVWPGDTPFSFKQQASIADSDTVNLTTLTLSAHTGTHIDAPWHYAAQGRRVAELPLEPYVGPAYVASIDRQHGGITPDDFRGHDLHGVERLLVHTWVSKSPDNTWPDNFPFPTVELIDWLASIGVVMLGVDMPSVDDFHSKDLPVHSRLFYHGMLNIELLMLDGVPDGWYELSALPLKIAGVCGSPVRAVLRSLEG